MAVLDSPGALPGPLEIESEYSAEEADAVAARRWLGLAVGVLVLAGLFAILLVIGRMPPFDQLFSDPLIFRRGLIVHVDLALVAWFYAFLTGMWFLLPSSGSSRAAHRSVQVAVIGIAMMVAGAGVPSASPVLSNYIPVIDHPLFLCGLITFFAGVSLAFLDRRLLPGNEVASGPVPMPEAARPGLRAAALAFLLAMATLLMTWVTTPPELPTATYYEFLFWGAGHILQVASVMGMVVAWLLLLNSALGRAPIQRRTGSILFGLLLLPLFAGPVLAGIGGATATYRAGFTLLMRWAIFPMVSVFLILCIRALVQAAREGRLPERGLLDPRLVGFYVSAGLTVLGFILGSQIRGSNTMVPAHYHASIGAVTASFMAVTWVIAGPLGIRLNTARRKALAGWQPAIFGIGQMIFAAGFGWAGAHGMARKTYGTEQQIHSTAEYAGLAVMGMGGLLAVVGGVLFLYLVVVAWRGSELNSGLTQRRSP